MRDCAKDDEYAVRRMFTYGQFTPPGLEPVEIVRISTRPGRPKTYKSVDLRLENKSADDLPTIIQIHKSTANERVDIHCAFICSVAKGDAGIFDLFQPGVREATGALRSETLKRAEETKLASQRLKITGKKRKNAKKTPKKGAATSGPRLVKPRREHECSPPEPVPECPPSSVLASLILFAPEQTAPKNISTEKVGE